ncbi:MAG: HNH endonuclease [Prochloraceae cyanobacterium]|nr:HNH endonuclease [Prochloraceae cyanobacterium]
MPTNHSRYPANWKEIALAVKESAGWRCRSCGKKCFRPGEKPKDLTRAQWTNYTLCVHHSNYNPEDNRPENLIPLCTPCHLSKHTGRRGSISPGQLSLW